MKGEGEWGAFNDFTHTGIKAIKNFCRNFQLCRNKLVCLFLGNVYNLVYSSWAQLLAYPT